MTTDRIGSLTDDRRYTIVTTRFKKFLCMVGSTSMLMNDFSKMKTYILDGDLVEGDESGLPLPQPSRQTREHL